MSTVPADLPFVDHHDLILDAGREVVWDALLRYADVSLRHAAGPLLARALGTRPAGGFDVSVWTPRERLALTGRHRFARYLLLFELTDVDDGGTRLRAGTYAAFPGPHGRAYRALVLGTRAHGLATRHLLRSVRRHVGGTGRA